jgi:hypothetical protein
MIHVQGAAPKAEAGQDVKWARGHQWPTNGRYGGQLQPMCRSREYRLFCAETGPSMDRDRTPGVDPLRSAYGLAIGSALILAEDAGRLAIVTCPGRKR